MHSIAVAGHVCFDLSPDLGSAPEAEAGQLVEVGPLSMRAGGSVANTGLALADLGASVTAYAMVGADRLGDLLSADLRDRGLDTTHIVAAGQGSTSYSVVVERAGSDRTFWHHTGCNAAFDGSGVPARPADILHLGYPPLLPSLLVDQGAPLVNLLARTRAAGTTTSVDLSVVDPRSLAGSADWNSILRAMCAHTDILTPSSDDLTSALRIDEGYSEALVERLADRMIADGVAIAAISSGAHGMLIRTGSEARFHASGPALAGVAHWANQSIHVAAPEVRETKSTNGAGDAASAALLFAVAIGADIGEAARLTQASSGAVIEGRRPSAAR